jgi:hypothetical protein
VIKRFISECGGRVDQKTIDIFYSEANHLVEFLLYSGRFSDSSDEELIMRIDMERFSPGVTEPMIDWAVRVALETRVRMLNNAIPSMTLKNVRGVLKNGNISLSHLGEVMVSRLCRGE